MQKVDEKRLEEDLQYRFKYLRGFMDFTAEDIAVITGAKELLAPVVPALVDAVYTKLFEYDATARHFLRPQHGYNGPMPEGLAELKQDHPLIKFRKDFLTRYLVRLVSGPYDANMVSYLDMTGAIHTAKAGNKDLIVPLVQMNALLGFVADAVTATIMSFNISMEAKTKALRAFGKLLWIQNDLINRHYAVNPVLTSAHAVSVSAA